MIYRSSNIRFNRQKYLSFWTIFCTFIPLTTQKIKILKIFWRYYHFTHVYQKSWSYATLFLRCDVQFLFFILGYFLPFYSLTTQKIKIKKKTHGDIILHMYTKNNDHMIYSVLEIWCMTEWWADRWTDRKSDI